MIDFNKPFYFPCSNDDEFLKIKNTLTTLGFTLHPAMIESKSMARNFGIVYDGKCGRVCRTYLNNLSPYCYDSFDHWLKANIDNYFVGVGNDQPK